VRDFPGGPSWCDQLRAATVLLWQRKALSIDLLVLDKQQRLVVIELKQTENGGHTDLQTFRHAAIVSP
jgi:hypothetical protein